MSSLINSKETHHLNDITTLNETCISQYNSNNENENENNCHLVKHVDCMVLKHSTWSCDLLFNLSTPAMPSKIVNLCDIIEKGEHYVFPDHFNDIEDKLLLITDLKLAAILS